MITFGEHITDKIWEKIETLMKKEFLIVKILKNMHQLILVVTNMKWYIKFSI